MPSTFSNTLQPCRGFWRAGAVTALAAGIAAVLAAGLAACGQPATPGAEDVARAQQLRPASAVLAEKYERSCMVCHTHVAAQAPLTGFAPAWQPRLGQGMEALLRHTQQGIRSMPPQGQCADCSAQELQALITFMAQGR